MNSRTNTPSPQKVLIFGSAMHVWSDLFFALLVPLLPHIKEELNLSYTSIGLLRSVYSGSSAILQIPAGLVAESTGEFWMLLGGNIWVGLGLIVMAVVPGFLPLIGATALGGLGGGTQHPLASSMVSRAYDSAGRSAAVGTVNFSGDIGKMIAPIVAGLLVMLGGWRATMWIVGAAGSAFMCISVFTRRHFDLGKPLIEHSPEKWDRKDSDKTSTIVGFIVLTGIGILDSATRSSTLVFFPFIFIERGMGESEVGVALFLLFAGGAAGKYICGWLDDRTGTLPLIWATKGMTTALIISAIFVPSFVLWPLAIILGVGLNGTSSVLYATVAKFIPTNKRARYYGLFYTTNEIGTVGAPLGYGLIADMIGLNRSVITMGVVTATILPASLALKRYLTVS